MSLSEQIKQIAKRQKLVSVLNRLNEIERISNEHEQLDLVILGQFKAGKSSLINSLLKDDLLPAGVLPVTAIITRISFGNEPKAVVTFTNNSKISIEISKLDEYINEKLNPENHKQVALVDIFIPAMKNYYPIRFVDTPGLGSIFTHNTETTTGWLGKIKAAIIVISASQPLSEHDIELIKQAAEQSPKVYILISKIDLINKQEQAEITSFVKNRLKHHFTTGFNFFTYSTTDHPAIHRKTIVEKIIAPLALETDKVQTEIYNHKLLSLAKRTIGYLTISLKLAEQKDEERKKLKSQIIDETLNLNFIKKDLNKISEIYKESTRDLLKAVFLDKHAKETAKKLTKELSNEFDCWKGNLAKVTHQYRLWIKKAIIKSIKDTETKEWENITAHTNEARQHFSIYLKSFHDRINQNIKRALEIDMPKSDINIEVSPVKSPPIHISRTFDSHIDMLWFLIPMVIFKKRVKNHFLKELDFEIEKNSYRLISQLNQNINKSIDAMHQQAIKYVEQELEGILATIEIQKTDEKEIEKMIKTITDEITPNKPA